MGDYIVTDWEEEAKAVAGADSKSTTAERAATVTLSASTPVAKALDADERGNPRSSASNL